MLILDCQPGLFRLSPLCQNLKITLLKNLYITTLMIFSRTHMHVNLMMIQFKIDSLLDSNLLLLSSSRNSTLEFCKVKLETKCNSSRTKLMRFQTAMHRELTIRSPIPTSQKDCLLISCNRFLLLVLETLALKLSKC